MSFLNGSGLDSRTARSKSLPRRPTSQRRGSASFPWSPTYGYRCQFVKAQELFDEMYASLADRSTRQFLKRLARLDVLLIDELGYLNLKPEQSNIFFKPMEERD